ncbi:MAG TPA: hypothetical protein VNS80_03290 [Pseudolysinimonas sp.]|nr:hypothetical protein [Pseudolysinimonas sp.]
MTDDDGPTLLGPIPPTGPYREALVWAIPLAAVVIGSCAIFGLLFWCGDGEIGSCKDPVETAELYQHAVRWIVTGALLGGGIIAAAPWGRVHWRLLAGGLVAVGVVGAGLIYLAL